MKRNGYRKRKYFISGIAAAVILCMSGGICVQAAQTEEKGVSAESDVSAETVNREEQAGFEKEWGSGSLEKEGNEKEQTPYEEGGITISFVKSEILEDVVYPGEQLTVIYRIDNRSDRPLYCFPRKLYLNDFSVPAYMPQGFLPSGESLDMMLLVRGEILAQAALTQPEQINCSFVIADQTDPDNLILTPILTAGDDFGEAEKSAEENKLPGTVLFDDNQITVTLIGHETGDVDSYDSNVSLKYLRLYCEVRNRSDQPVSLLIPETKPMINDRAAIGWSVVAADNTGFTAGESGIAMFQYQMIQDDPVETADLYLRIVPEGQDEIIVPVRVE